MSNGSRRNGAFPGAFVGDVMLWGGAALAVVAAHAGAVLWAMHKPPVMASEGPPPAIMIELAAMSEATDTQATELTEDQQDSAASQAAQQVKAPEPVPEPVEEEPVEEFPPDAVEPMDEAQPEEIEAEAEVAMPSSQRPKLRPERVSQAKPAPPKPQRTPTATPQQQSAAAQSAVQTQNSQAQKSSRNAAAQSSRGAGSTLRPAKWQARLMAHLERHKPRSKGERGLAYVTFRIDAAGQVSSVRLARSSGNAGVDQAALSLVRRSSPVPPPPPGVQHSLTVPVKFSRR